MTQIAIIGSGMAAMTAMHHLLHTREDIEITCIDKARGISGRLSTRYINATEQGIDRLEFDHGARYFKARSDAFKAYIKPYIGSALQDWSPKIVHLNPNGQTTINDDMAYYVGTPRMNSFPKAIYEHLQEQFPKRLHTHLHMKVQSLKQDEGKWCVIDDDGKTLKGFDWVICTAPSTQTLEILPSHFDGYNRIKQVQMGACFSLMLGFEGIGALDHLDFDGAFVPHQSGLSIDWICKNHTKPNRSKTPTLVMQTTVAFSEQHLQTSNETIINQIMQDLKTLVSIKAPTTTTLHKWRFAHVKTSLNDLDPMCDFLIDPHLKLMAIGDWCAGAKVEGAFTSAFKGAQALIQTL